MRGKSVRIIASLIIVLGALVGIGGCVYYYGQGVVSYYHNETENVPEISEVYYLENGVSLEQDFVCNSNYMIGLDLILIGTGSESQGTLYTQLYNQSGEMLSQKKEQLADIEPGQFYPIRFLNTVETKTDEMLTIRVFTEDVNEIPGILAISPTSDADGNLQCRVNGKQSTSVILTKYVYGRLEYVGYEWKTNGIKQTLVAAIVLILCVSCCIIGVINNFKWFTCAMGRAWQEIKKNTKSFMGLLWFGFIFLNSAAIFKLRCSGKIPIWVYLYDIILLVVTGLWVKNHNTEIKNGIWNVVRVFKDRNLVLLILISTIVRIPLFVHEQLLDAGIYYHALQQACEMFNFSWASIWSSFRLCAHYSIAYTIFMSIGEFLFPGNMTGVLMVALILTEMAIACIYIMLHQYWLKLDGKAAMLVTLLISVCPLLLGMFSNVTLDSMLIIFTIFLLYAEYKENTFMIIIWLLVIAQTKETGMVIVGGYLLAHVISRGINTIKRKENDRLCFFFSDYSVICCFAGVILLCVYTVAQHGMFLWLGMSDVVQGNLFTQYIHDIFEHSNLFGQKLKLLFLLHFQWIPTLTIVFCGTWRKLVQKEKTRFPGMLSYCGILAAFLISNVYLFTYSLARYHIFSSVMMWILAIIYLFITFPHCFEKKIGQCAAWGIVLLVSLQNFFCLDPVTNMAFELYNTGNGKILSTEIAGGNFGDCFINNGRHLYLYGLIDEMLSGGQYDENTQIVIPYDRDYNMLYYGAAYDKNKMRRVHAVAPDGNDTISLEQVLLPELLEKDSGEMPLRGIMFFLPYIECDEQELVAKAKTYYDVSEPHDLSNWGGTLRYYILTKK